MPRYGGSTSGGWELFPGREVQAIPHFGGSEERVSAKPSKLSGADPPLKVLTTAHCAPQNVSSAPNRALWSPSTKQPLVRNAN